MASVAELERKILRDVGRAIGDWSMIEDGDRVMVAVSGGKDSYAMLEILRILQGRAPIRFELVAVHLDQGQPGYDGAPLRNFLEAGGYTHHILREDTYSVVMEKVPEGATYCSLCSRLRRGVLYNAAMSLGCTKIALGHHRDDAIETLLLNLLFAGKIAAMPARLVSDDGRNTVIRPMIHCAEETLAAFAQARGYPILPCNLCGSQETAQRKRVKALLGSLEAEHAGIKSSVYAALGNVRPTQLLDRALAVKPEDLAKPARRASLGDGRLRVLADE
ncbi:MAG: tRNA 2-thiocytidine(32) synthetase TtcA [Polyangiales bacterium]